MKKLLMVMNPCAGVKRANRFLPQLLSIFSQAGYAPLVLMTEKHGDGIPLARAWAPDMDLVVCVGGDGTFNEVVSGVYLSGAKTPIGYIPAGSTNDFATSLKLSTNILQAARDIVSGKQQKLDIGSFSGRYFTYIASFGAFTRASYATPQNMKNALGHLAYLLGGIKELGSIHKLSLSLKTAEGEEISGSYIFGGISNSTSMAGIFKLDPNVVDMNDGLFELLLVKSPANLAELSEAVRAMTTQDYSSPMLVFRNTSQVTLTTAEGMDWTLDGEFAKGSSTVEIKNLHDAITVMTGDKK